MLPEGCLRIARWIVDPRIHQEGEGVEPRRSVCRPRPVHYDSPLVAVDEYVVGSKINVGEPITAHRFRGGGGQGLQQGMVLYRPRVEPGVRVIPQFRPALENIPHLVGQRRQGLKCRRRQRKCGDGVHGIEDSVKIGARQLRVPSLNIAEHQSDPLAVVMRTNKVRDGKAGGEQRHDPCFPPMQLRRLGVQRAGYRLHEKAAAFGRHHAIRTAGGVSAGLGVRGDDRTAHQVLDGGPYGIRQVGPPDAGTAFRRGIRARQRGRNARSGGRRGVLPGPQWRRSSCRGSASAQGRSWSNSSDGHEVLREAVVLCPKPGLRPDYASASRTLPASAGGASWPSGRRRPL